MCGIAGMYLRKTPAPSVDPARFAENLLLSIEHRGKDATGYAAIFDSGKVVSSKAPLEAWDFLNRMERPIPSTARAYILHTRLATQGLAKFNRNNHPVRAGSWYVVHNGQIWNDNQVMREVGWKSQAECDSESIAAALNYNGYKRLETALESLEGSFAIAAFASKSPNRLVLARSDWSPLHYFVNDTAIVWASEPEALRWAWSRSVGTPPDWRRIQSLMEGEYLVIDRGNITKGRFTPKTVPVYSRTSYYNDGWKELGGKKVVVIQAGQRHELTVGNLDTSQKVLDALAKADNLPAPWGDPEEEDENMLGDVDVRCESCLEYFKMREMHGHAELYCGDCWHVWTSQ